MPLARLLFRLRPGGASVASFSSEGNSNGRFLLPQGLAVLGDSGAVLVADGERSALQTFTPAL